MNKYQIIDTIGEGEYGVVLKAKNKQTSELVAIKKFKEDDSDDENKRVILRQVKILKMLAHQNIIELKQAFRKKGKIYLVCEFVEKNLLQILQQNPLPPSKLRHYTYQLLKGIQFMHSLNIIHRDIKPENLLIGKDDVVKICDLGFARTMPSNGIMTDYVATRWYRPPQLLIGRDDYDKSIDIWAIGCVMAEMIDGQPLFGGENDLDQLYLIQKCLGPLTSQQNQHFLKNPKFLGMKFPEINAMQPIQRRYFGKIDKLGLDLLKKMLVMDPKGRISAQKALTHPYFHRVSSISQTQIKKSFHQISKNIHEDNQVRSNLPMNNFIQDQKTLKIKEEKGGVNKVTGLGKISRIQLINNGHGNHQQAQSPFIFNKNKSLTKKTAHIIGKEKSIISQQRYNKMAIGKNRKADQEDEYEGDEHWAQEKQEIKRQTKPKNQKKYQIAKQNEEKGKKIKWNLKRDNINIIFNNNTYNLNIVEDSTAR